MTRKMTREEAREFGRNLPISLWLDQRGKPLMSRAEWEQLPRGRRFRDMLLYRHPPKWFTEGGQRRD
jgi:hypothetical protein